MKLLKATIGIIWMLALMFAIGLPFANPWWFLYSFAVCILAIAHGNDIQEWLFKGV